ncbi:hypothetical protein H6G97_20945 [Nostoc flagelliforme FACHB-838]|uniref:Uncharacterized protein n=1 Tax=Nostoc flagelliforme FACHB-838 TaxID=2692904 RepID=A0ABR8DS08_9NOSO|nr:hypothetical protein [Nostoc flagelliforme]MBD2531918.1 hypothetical protein [Nostoc flagelliforme FACHB-838]
MHAFNFLSNAVGGALMNVGVSGIVGQVMGVGVALAFHPALILLGVVVGGMSIAMIREINQQYEEPRHLYLVVDNTRRF